MCSLGGEKVSNCQCICAGSGEDLPNQILLLLDLVPLGGECNMTETRAMAKKIKAEVLLSVLPFYTAVTDAHPRKTRRTKGRGDGRRFSYGNKRMFVQSC